MGGKRNKKAAAWNKEVGQNGMLRQVNLVIEARQETEKTWAKADITSFTIQSNFALEPKLQNWSQITNDT